MFLVSFAASAQCNITSSAPACVGNPINFFSNSPGASAVSWNFNSQGTSSQNDPSFVFSTPGTKTITLSLTTATGQACNTSTTITVYPSPIINLKRISSKTQCFAGNSFCFVDSSTGGSGGIPIKSIKYAFDDGELITTSGDCNNNGVLMPRTFCKSFSDPQGGTYGVTIEIENCFGCITKIKLDEVAIVKASLGLKFTSDKPRRCDSAVMTVTNQSTVPFSNVLSWVWNWGDGTFNTTQWGPTVKHTYYAQGPNGGEFNATLTVTTKDSCTESFTFNAAAYNLILKPSIIATKDSACIADATIGFSLKGGSIPGGTSPLYTYEHPRGLPANFTRGWAGTHKFGGLGPHKVTFSYAHPVPGCSKTVFDTILVIGPQSTIEGSITSGMRFIEDTMRYQCVITDTVKFYNFSKFYHNDKNYLDDDSLITVYDSLLVNKFTSKPDSGATFNPAIHMWVYPGFNKPLVHVFEKIPPQRSVRHPNQQRGNSCTQRLWDFDDDFCEKCTTDTKNGVNVGKNCKFSKDTLPQHWYTPWDSVYLTDNSLRSERVLNYSKDSGLCYQRRLWSSDSVAIIRDTILYYGDNALAKKTKDSIIYKNIKKKVMVGNYVKGPWRYDMTVATKFFLKAGNRAYNDLNNGLPPNLLTGQRYFTIQPGNSLVIYSKNDSAFYNVWLEYIQDTIPKHLIQPWHKVWKKERIQGFAIGDSINAAAHRQKFYSGTTVRCFNVRLNHKDICHTLKCEDEAIAQLALQPPSAKKLRKVGISCLGSDQDNYGVTFILEDTKPGCSRTFAKINFDTALNKTGWVTAIGANLTPGAISAGDLPPINPPYQVPAPGYQVNGPAGSRFSKQFSVDDIEDSITGYINVGLIVGNGIWRDPNAPPDDDLNYPPGCIDTIYYPKFTRFPFLDNKFRIIKPKEGTDYTKICRKDTICLALLSRNRTYVPDVAEATWTLEGANVGKFYNQYYRLDVSETYSRFQKIAAKDTIPGDYKKLGDYITVRKSVYLNSPSGSGLPPVIDDETLDSQKILISRVEKWHTEADITPVFDIIKTILLRNNIDVFELTPTQLAELIWNGQGTFGVPYTGSRGCLDTTGFGRFIRFYKVADQKQILHYRDFSLSPIEEAKTIVDNTDYLDTCGCNELGRLNAQWLAAGGFTGTGKTLTQFIFTSSGGLNVANPDSLVVYCKRAIINVQQAPANGSPKQWIPGVTKWNEVGKEYINHLARENNWRAPIQFKCLLPTVKERSYCFVPQFSGYYVANYGLRSTPPENCTKQTGTAKKVIVGFYGVMNYNDTILCHGQTVTAEPQFRYFNVYPELGGICNLTGTPLLDCIDYWRNRIGEAGNINREGYTRWDLSKDDDGTDPRSIFGGFPYSATGLGNTILTLGGNTNGLYYLKDTGYIYHIRTAASDSFGCKDTFPQDVYISAVRAKFKLDQKRPQCNTIIELFDSSYIMDPCRGVFQNNDSCDWIVKWTVNWGDGQRNSINNFFLGSYPGQVGHDYTRNGAFKVIWRVESRLGCVDYDTIDIYIPGPIPFFDTFIPRKYCVNEKVSFKNLSTYVKRDSSTWLWQFGDGEFASQYDTITPANDTISHRYKKPGRYAVYLRHFFKLVLGTQVKTCNVVYPDTLGGQQPIFYIDIVAYDTVKLKVDRNKICPGDVVNLTGQVKPYKRYSNYRWHFGQNPGDTLITTDTFRTQRYPKEGKYTIKFMGDKSTFPTTEKICAAEDSVKIEVFNVVADFDIDSTREPIFCFNNKSTGSTKHQWGIYGKKDVMAVNPASARGFKIDIDSLQPDASNPQVCRDYRDSLGEYWVCLEAINDIGCRDTICKKLVNNFESGIKPPNVFSPNNGADGFQGLDGEGLKGNDVFNIEIKGEEKYDLVIYDRWGVKVFESKDKMNDWNGKVKNTGADCPDGTYYYILKYRYKGKDKDEPVLNGVVQIIRGK